MTKRARRVSSAGVELAVVEEGEEGRPVILLIHGYPDTKEVWADVAERLSGRYHVVAYDVRGAGESDAPKDGASYDLERLVDDALAVMDAVAPERPVHLVGHDWGSVQGWELATSPHLAGRLASFTSISGPSLDHVARWMRDRLRRPTPAHLAELVGQGARSWYVYAGMLPVVPGWAWRSVIGPRWPGLLEHLEGVSADDGHPAATVGQDGANGLHQYRRNVPARLQHPRPDATAHVPVQLIVPNGDRYLSDCVFDDLDRWAPILRRRRVSGGHWVPRTQPDRLAGWIAEFVDDVTRGRPLGRRRPLDPTQSFKNRLVLVTGAGSGIGRATALAFAAAEAEVISVDRDAASATRTAELAGLAGAAAAHAKVVDVKDGAAMEDLAKSVLADYGVVDILVNNAGIGTAGPFLDTSVEDWQRTLDVNLWGVIHGCRLFASQMVERGEGGHIVNVASAAGFQPSKTLPAYSTSKAAVLMLSECLRAELGQLGIGVTAICPGFVNTNITRTTHFVGQSSAEESRSRDRATRLYGLRNFPPERVAAEILAAVTHNRAVVPVTGEAKLSYALARVAPGLLRALARANLPV